MRTEPLRLFAPRRQPLPNTAIYAEHLLDQCRRLILGRRGLTVVLLEDPGLRQKLTTELAGEFGSRVIHQGTAPDVNGVICCGWSWWMDHQNQLPALDQLIIALLPVSSLEDPLRAADGLPFWMEGSAHAAGANRSYAPLSPGLLSSGCYRTDTVPSLEICQLTCLDGRSSTSHQPGTTS